MKRLHNAIAAVVATTSVAFSLQYVPAQAYTLTNGTGDGTLQVGVDGFGSFGSSVGGTGITNAFYNPVGPGIAAGTTYESGIAIGLNGSRDFLTIGNIGGSGGLSAPTISGTPTSATSSFSYEGLNFNLTQNLSSLFDTAGTQTGSVLNQRYSITNSTSRSLSFDLVRYLDGDLSFDGSIQDGGGRLSLGGTETLFETDASGGAANVNTFVGITATGGQSLTQNRYEIDSFSGLLSRVNNGTALDNTITGDTNSDGFIDNPYDVTLALRNAFNVDPGATVDYLTQTIFGSGIAPASIPGSSQDIPLLPQEVEPGRFVFEDVPAGLWYDPPFTTAFEYNMLSAGSLFTEILNFPTGFSDGFTVSVGNTVLGQFGPGDSVDFTGFAGGGVSQFMVSDITPAVDAANPLAFPLQIDFSTPTASFEMVAVEPVPEPTSILGTLVFGAFGVNWLRKRQRN